MALNLLKYAIGIAWILGAPVAIKTIEPITNADQISGPNLDLALTKWIAALTDRVVNPLAGFRAALEILEKQITLYKSTGKCDPTVASVAVQMSKDRLERLNSFISELAAFSHTRPLNPKPVNLRELISHVISKKYSRSNWIGNIHTHLEANAHIVQGDQDKLEISLSALLENAIEAVPADRMPEIVVEAKHLGPVGKGEIVISVTDNGVGISEDHLPQVVFPFFTTKEASSGLGLSIVEKCLAAHGGHLNIKGHSELGGAQVAMHLPDSYT